MVDEVVTLFRESRPLTFDTVQRLLKDTPTEDERHKSGRPRPTDWRGSHRLDGPPKHIEGEGEGNTSCPDAEPL
jgi:hypothetical protein